jgi:small subunit ribosomal protein S1
MSAHHVDLPEQVVTPGEELWVKIIDLDVDRRRISLSIKQAAEGGTVAAEFQEHFGEHNYDAEGNYVGPATEFGDGEPSEAQAAWGDVYGEEEAAAAAVADQGDAVEAVEVAEVELADAEGAVETAVEADEG